MKKIAAFVLGAIVLAAALYVGIERGGNMQRETQSMKGESVFDIRKTFRNDMTLYLGPLFAFEDDDKIVVLRAEAENDIINGEVVFDKNGKLLISSGVTPLASDIFATAIIHSVQDMEAAFGNRHADIGSGAEIAAYIIDDGRIVTYHVRDNDILKETVYSVIDGATIFERL